jgi:hypothetical protein
MVFDSRAFHTFFLRHSRESGNPLLRHGSWAVANSVVLDEAARSLYESMDFYTINRARLYGKKR